MDSFQERTGAFGRYGNEAIKLVGYFSCSGCKELVLDEKGLERKLEALQREDVKVVHFGSCVKKQIVDGKRMMCPEIVALKQRLEAMGIEVIGGTNRLEELE